MKKTPYHRSQRNRALEELTAELRALRAEVAMLRASQVQIVPYPYPVYPQPYVPYRYPHPVNPWWNPYIVSYTSDMTNVTLQGGNNLSVGAGCDFGTNVVLGSAVGG